MAPQCENSVKVKPHQAVSSFSAQQFLVLLLLLSLYLSQRTLTVSSQQDLTSGKTSFASSSSSFASSSSSSSSPKGGGSQSKTNDLNSGLNFRERIVHIQRKQQQQQHVVEQQQQQVVEQQPVQQQRVVQVEQSIETKQEQQQQVVGSSGVVEQSSIFGSIKGTPGVDFPAYSSIPNTKFSCSGAPYDPGMYADETTGCQVYHMCYQGRRESFLCGEGTVFNQAIMNCDFWHSVECSKSSSYYNLNADFGKSSSEPSGASSGSTFFQQRVLQAAQLPPPPPVQQTFQLEEQFRSGGTKGGGNGLTNRLVVNSNFRTKSSGAPSSSFRDYQQFSAQRKSAALPQAPLSPSRRVNQLNSFDQSLTQNQFSSAESSPMRSISSTSKGESALELASQPVEQVGSSLVVTNELDETSQAAAVQPQPVAKGNTFGAKTQAVKSSVSQTVGQSTKEQIQKVGSKTSVLETNRKTQGTVVVKGAPQEETNSVWKPYFKSKTKTSLVTASSETGGDGGGGKGGANQSQPKYPSLTAGKSTTRGAPQEANGPQNEGTTTGRPSTLAQPDKEPNFGGSGGDGEGTRGEATETPKVPKGGPPPSAETTTTSTTTPAPATDQTTTASPAAIESDVGQALSSTTPAAESGGAPSPAEAPTTTTPAPAPAPTTTTTTTAEPSSGSTSTESPPPPPPLTTTTSEPSTTTTTESPPVTTTTTTTIAPTTTTTTAASESSTPAGEGGEKEEGNSGVEMTKKKKRRGALTAGVEYAQESSKKKNKKKKAKITTTNRANSSSVEFATS